MDFRDLDLEQLQMFAYPLIKAITGFDVAEEVAGKADVLLEAGALFSKMGQTLTYGGESLSDGILDNDELNTIFANAPDFDAAMAAIIDAWYDDEEEDVDE